MNEQQWIVNATSDARPFVSSHEEMMEDLGIETGTIREELLMNLFYSDPLVGIKLDVGIIDLCNKSEFLRLKADSEEAMELISGTSDTAYSMEAVESGLVDPSAPNQGFSGEQDIVFVDSPFLGQVFLIERFLSIEPLGINFRSDQYSDDLNNFLKDIGLDAPEDDEKEN